MSVCVCNVKALPATSPTAAAAPDAANATDAASDVLFVLEMDELNQHECMSSLVSLMRHMHLSNITTAVQQVTSQLP